MAQPPPPPPESPDDDAPEVLQHRVPGWVKGFIIAAIVVGVLVILGLALSGGSHGPGRHLPAGGHAAVQTPHGEDARADRR